LHCFALLSIFVVALLRSCSAALLYSPSCSFIAAGSFGNCAHSQMFCIDSLCLDLYYSLALPSIIVFALLRTRSPALPYSPSCSFSAAGSSATALNHRGIALLRSAQHRCSCSASLSLSCPASLASTFCAAGSSATALMHRRFALLRSALHHCYWPASVSLGLATALNHRGIALLRSAQHRCSCSASLSLSCSASLSLSCSASLSLSCSAVVALVQLYCCWLIGNCADTQRYGVASLCSASLCCSAPL
jgi:hypothetical protein